MRELLGDAPVVKVDVCIVYLFSGHTWCHFAVSATQCRTHDGVDSASKFVDDREGCHEGMVCVSCGRHVLWAVHGGSRDKDRIEGVVDLRDHG